MYPKRPSCIATVAIVAISALASAASLPDLEKWVVEYKLRNGMTFLIVRRPGAPVFSANITFRAGGIDERPGITGLAHLTEHMAFKGTRRIGTRNYRRERRLLRAIDEVAVPLSLEIAKADRADRDKIRHLRARLKKLQEKARRYVVKDELWDTYLRHGGTGLNATTSKDWTRYYVSLPANRLELWAWLESDRLLNPVFREFYSERDVVCEEHRLSIETRPEGTLYRDFLATAFIAHPARYMTIGWMSDIQTVTRREAIEFHKHFYCPANCAVAIVGDIDVDQCKRTVRRYFGRIPRRPKPRPIRTREPQQRGERRFKVQWDAQPQLVIGFHKPDPLSDEEPVFEIIQGVLSRGRTSRFYKTIVEKLQLATSVECWTGPTERYPNLFVIWAIPRHPHTAREVENAIYDVLDSLVENPPAVEEIEKVRNNLKADLLRQMQSNRGLASTLSYYQAIFGDWRHVLRRLERIERVTPGDVQRVARKYFVATNRTVGEIVPSKKTKKEGMSDE